MADSVPEVAETLGDSFAALSCGASAQQDEKQAEFPHFLRSQGAGYRILGNRPAALVHVGRIRIVGDGHYRHFLGRDQIRPNSIAAHHSLAVRGLGDFQRAQMRVTDPRIHELFRHLRQTLEILE
jgi:hypothetical protein